MTGIVNIPIWYSEIEKPLFCCKRDAESEDSAYEKPYTPRSRFVTYGSEENA